MRLKIWRTLTIVAVIVALMGIGIIQASAAVTVPQVRWVGEQIVLEANFGIENAGYPVAYTLVAGSSSTSFVGGTNKDEYWTYVNENGIAQAILTSTDPVEAGALAQLYAPGEGTHGEGNAMLSASKDFTVYFLKFEDLRIGNVKDSQIKTDPGTVNDVTEDCAKVTNEQLLRARVRGWFVNSNPSQRGAENNKNGTLNPAGRWVLPDDWEILAGQNMEWDLHDNPFNVPNDVDGPGPWFPIDWPGDIVPNAGELGSFLRPDGSIAVAPVVGPYDPLRPETILNNGELDQWDTPMPPAHVNFKMQDNPTDPYDYAGYFLRADKGTLNDSDITNNGAVYYNENDRDGGARTRYDTYGNIIYDGRYYAPFYRELIPSNSLIIPVPNSTSGYSPWDDGSGYPTFGEYDFWSFAPPAPPEPKEVSVYSDEHGEAMVWLTSGDEFNLARYMVNQTGVPGYDIPLGSEVGQADVKVIAEYPYVRNHPKEVSVEPKITKHWKSQWSKELSVEDLDNSQKKVIATLIDIHGKPIVEERVEFTLTSGGGKIINVSEPGSIPADGGRAIAVTDRNGKAWVVVENHDSTFTDVKAVFPQENIKRAITLTWNVTGQDGQERQTITYLGRVNGDGLGTWFLVGAPTGTNMKAWYMYSYDGTDYDLVDPPIATGKVGYWAMYGSPTSVPMTFDLAQTGQTVNLRAGWTLVGNEMASPAIVSRTVPVYVFVYDSATGAYHLTDRIPVGGGAWIYSSIAMPITLNR